MNLLPRRRIISHRHPHRQITHHPHHPRRLRITLPRLVRFLPCRIGLRLPVLGGYFSEKSYF